MIINDPVMRAQHEAVRNTAGWYCFTHYLLEVTGADATALLDKIYVSSIAKVKVGRAKYTCMLNEDGIIIDDVIVFHIDEDKYWISTLHLNNKLLPWLDDHKGDSDVVYEDITNLTEMYAVQGPRSRDLLNTCLAENIDDQKYFSIRDNRIGDVPVKVARSGYTGELGYEIYVASENAGFIEARLAECGKALGAVEVTEFQVKVWSLPTEKGYYLMSDLRGTNPFEVGFEASIDWSKDFIGKKALEKVRAEGPKRQILGFIADDETVQIEGMNRGSYGAVVRVNGEEAGRVTKYVYSYTLGKSIGFALVDRTKAKAGDRAVIGGHAATLTERIWYDVENKRPFGN
jgi:aminomethyltransferase